MAISGNSQALVAAFVFGIVVTVASAAFFLFVKGAGSSLFRDGLRLVLVNFLASSVVWALVQLVTIVVDFSSLSGCQVVIVIASAFDQLARVSLEQFLLWGIKGELSLSLGTLLPQSIILLRFILGGVFVGVQRPQLSPVCVTTTLLVPLGIVVLVTDAFVVLMLFTRAYSTGRLTLVGQDVRASTRSKGLLLIIAGLGIWTALSTPMILGIESFQLALRTITPAVGLLIAIGLVIVFKNSLDFSLATVSELDSDDDRWRDVSSPRNISAHDTQTRGLATSGPLSFPQKFEKPKMAEANPPQRPILSRDGSLPIISRPNPGQAQAGVGGVPVQGQLFPPRRSQTAPVVLHKANKTFPKSFYGKNGKLLISNPTVSGTDEQNPLNKVATIDLVTAAKNDRDRRNMVPQALFSMTTPRVAPPPPVISAEDMRKRPQALERKQVGAALTSNSTQEFFVKPNPEYLVAATTTSAQLSPGTEEVRRRSPRTPSQPFQELARAASAPSKTQLNSIRQTVLQPHIATIALKPPVRSPNRPYPAATNPVQHKDVLPNGRHSPSGGSQRGRAAGSTSPRRAKSTRIFTDPNVPPAIPPTIPMRHPERFSSQPRHFDIPLVAPLQPLRKSVSPQSQGETHGYSLSSIAGSSRQGASHRAAEQQPRNSTATAGSRSTTALPANPRANFTSTWVSDQGVPQQQQQQQTVMFINSIEYNDPNVVQTILSGTADKMLANTPVSDRDSVVNRPRPIPRYSSISHSIFPSDEQANFGPVKYSPSGISTKTKRLTVFSTPGSPNERMELTPLPKTAGLFPQSEAEMPAAPFSGLASVEWKPNQQWPLVPGSMEVRGPERLPSLSSGRREIEKGTVSRFSVDQATPVASRYASKFSIDTSYSSIEEPQSGLSRFSGYENSSYEGSKRQSSPIIPFEGMLSPPLSAELKDDDASDCGSVQSPVDVRASSNTPLRTSVSTSGIAATPKASCVGPEPVFATENDGKETMTIMLDPRTQHHLEAQEGVARGVSSERDMQFKRARWHRRVGEECPTFSDRKMRTVPRKVFRPASLQLNRPAKMATIIEAEPSPCESPSDALNKIQEQLRNLDTLEEELSPLSPLSSSSSSEQHRMSLLANLEAEMGMQESRWQQMRRDLAQASPSASQNSAMTTPRHRSIELSPTAQAGERSSMLGKPDVLVSPQNSSRSRDTGDGGNWSASMGGPIYKHASTAWRGPEVRQTEDATRWPKHSGSAVSKMKLLSVARRTIAPLSSPTPPDTDESGSDCDSEVEVGFKPDKSTVGETHDVQDSALWRPEPPTPDLTILSPNPLWTLNAELTCAPPPESEPTTISAPEARPLPRKSSESLHIESSDLWTKSETVTKSDISSLGGLWETASASVLHLPPPEPESESEPVANSNTRPRTLKPPRRSKRVSTLPDILENPEPLLNKRGTLGIYQFPWGEKSDTATPQPHVRLFAPMPGTMSSGGNSAAFVAPVARSRTLESQSYPPGFFDQYDDENGGDNFGDYSGSDITEDDDFDETTLWEIASLLRSDDVPSRDSLFPVFSMEEAPSTPLTESAIRQSTHEENSMLVGRSSSTGLDTGPLPLSPRSATLWVKEDNVPSAFDINAEPHRQDNIWQSYLDRSSTFVRAPTRKSVPTAITSTALWASEPKATDIVPAGQLWSGRAVSESKDVAVASLSVDMPEATPARNLLWRHPVCVAASPKGLPQPNSEVWNSYLIPKDLNTQAKHRTATPASIDSSSLWTFSEPKKPFLHRPGMLWYSMEQEAIQVMDSEATPIPDVSGIDEPVYANAGTVSRGLWTPPVKVEYEEPEGLFSVSHKRADFRSTIEKPVALGLRPVARAQDGPLQISSSSLWTQPIDHSFTQDWITLSSIRPGTPGGNSSSGAESVQTDASSFKSGATGISTLGSLRVDYAKHVGTRPTATPEQWAAALQEAIQASQPAAPVSRAESEVVENEATAQTNTDDQSSPKASPSRLSPIWQRLWSKTT